jgi:hypothetical protein
MDRVGEQSQYMRNHLTTQIHFQSYHLYHNRPCRGSGSRFSLSEPGKADDQTGLAPRESETPEDIPAKATNL